MNKVIWKFTVPLSNCVDIEMPTGAEVISVGMQRGALCMWAKVDPDAPMIMREFMVEGTGQPPNRRLADAVHWGTTQDGSMVWHLFEVEGG